MGKNNDDGIIVLIFCSIYSCHGKATYNSATQWRICDDRVDDGEVNNMGHQHT